MSARRTKTRYPGVYWREGANGKRRYEVSFVDSTGRRRWKVVGDSEKQARDFLADVRSRKTRGERITPGKATVAELAAEYLEQATGTLRPGSRRRYEGTLRLQVLPHLGRLRASELTPDDVASWLSDLAAGVGPDGETVRPLKPWTCQGSLVALGRVLGWAARRGTIPRNIVRDLQRGERPSPGRRDQRVLSPDELALLLDHADERYRPVIATAALSGLRLGELVGLRWRDIGDVIHVREQYGWQGYSPLKTGAARRDVILAPSLGRLLAEHRLRSSYSGDADPVFSNRIGRPLDSRNCQRALAAAADAAELNPPGVPRLRLHDLRHSFVSALIGAGADPATVAKQAGHSSAAVTLGIYAHAFDAQRSAEATRDAIQAAFGNAVEQTDGNRRQQTPARVAQLRGSGSRQQRSEPAG